MYIFLACKIDEICPIEPSSLIQTTKTNGPVQFRKSPVIQRRFGDGVPTTKIPSPRTISANGDLSVNRRSRPYTFINVNGGNCSFNYMENQKVDLDSCDPEFPVQGKCNRMHIFIYSPWKSEGTVNNVEITPVYAPRVITVLQRWKVVG